MITSISNVYFFGFSHLHFNGIIVWALVLNLTQILCYLVLMKINKGTANANDY